MGPSHPRCSAEGVYSPARECPPPRVSPDARTDTYHAATPPRPSLQRPRRADSCQSLSHEGGDTATSDQE